MTAGRIISIKVLAPAGALVFALALFFWGAKGGFSNIKNLDLVQNWPVVLALVLLWFVLPSRFKCLHRPLTLRSSVLIDAPLSAVWHRVLLHPGRKHFFPGVIEILGDEIDSDHFSLRFDPVGKGDVPLLQLRVDEIIDHAFLRIIYLNAADCPMWSKDLKSSEYIVEREGFRTRLTIVEQVEKINASAVVAILFLRPCKTSALRIKTLCETCSEISLRARLIDPTCDKNNGWERITHRGAIWVCSAMTFLSLLGVWRFI